MVFMGREFFSPEQGCGNVAHVIVLVDDHLKIFSRAGQKTNI
jgi:hypothetical protein